jgi:hypothetical protein
VVITIPPYVKLPDFDVSPSFMVDHNVRYIHKDDKITMFRKSGVTIRFRSKEFESTIKNNLTFARKIYYIDLNDLPPQVEGKIYVVSKTVASLLAGKRDDFAYPGTHPDYDGAKIVDSSIVGVRRFRLPDILVTDEGNVLR